MTDASRHALGDFLRTRREKLRPRTAEVGSPRRRTPGLRRQEVAELAGIGVDWYIRLEQGRAVSPSAATIDALARALRLSTAEHAHLRALAGHADPQAFMPDRVPESVRRLVAGLNAPAYVTNRRLDVLAWNAAAADLLTDFGQSAVADRNILVYMLLDGRAKTLFGAGWADEARRIIAQFRTTYDLYARDAAFVDLVARLQHGSAEFAGWWPTHDVRAVGGGQKMLCHPRRGVLHVEYATFQANDDPALRLAIYTAIGAERVVDGQYASTTSDRAATHA